MDVFLMVRMKNLTVFLDVKEHTTVLELKNIINGLIKVKPSNQQLFYKDNKVPLVDEKALIDYGLTAASAKAQNPATIGLVVRENDMDEFGPLLFTPYSAPPDLPDVMKSAETNGGQEAAA